MGLAFPTQRFQDWFTQQWVIIRGRRVDPAQVPWLMGPFGRVGGIGEAFIDQLAEKEGLLIERQSNGLIPSMSGLRLPAPDLARLSRTVRNFYENTANFDLAFSVEWNPLFRAFGVLTNKLFSNRINQLNIPTRNLKDTESLRSEIITLAEPQTKERKYTVWFRTNASNAQVIYSGVYGTCTLPSGKTCVKAVFPLPNGNATVLMTPSVGANGELILDSSGKTFGDAGFYFLLEDSKGNFWAQFVRSFRDRLTVREESDHLTAEQTLTLFNLRVATFRYRIVAKKS
jgi:hypothetical protein